MKKFTLLAIAALLSVVSFAQVPVKRFAFQQPIERSIMTESVSARAKSLNKQVPVQTKVNGPMKSVAAKVAPPESAEELQYSMEGLNTYEYNGEVYDDDWSSRVSVVFDGTDVYIKSLAPYYMQDAWVKGTLDGSTVTFPDQFIGTHASYGVDFYVAGASSVDDTEYGDVVFSYDAATKVFTLQNVILNYYSAGWIDAYREIVLTPLSTDDIPQTVTVPDNLVTKELPIKGSYYQSSQSYSYEGVANVGFVGDEVYIQGLSSLIPTAWVKGVKQGNQLVIPTGQYIGVYNGNDMWLLGYNADITFTIQDEDIYVSDSYIFENGKPDAIYYFRYFASGLTIGELKAVELPAGAELVEYSLSYETSAGAAGSGTAAVAVVGNDVYFKGFSSYIPDALIKGTKEGNTITFPANQYLGSYADYDSFFMDAATFTYDEATDTYTSTDHVYSVLGAQYYDVNYYNPVLKGVVEKAATPANPAITGLANGQYGYYITFNVPNVDTNGEGLVASKLFYEIFTDVEHDVQPLTFTPSTHSKLTDALTVIPFGFSEQYDFYDTQIFLNDLYSADWNKIGIKSIYEGGGETHETEIQWYTIKAYAIDVAREALTAEIATAEALLDAEALPEGVADFQAVIDAAKALVANEDATAAELNAAVTALQEAEAAYKDANGFGEAQWVASEQGYSNADAVTSFTIDENVSGLADKATGSTAPQYYTTGSALRLYGGNTLTIGGENVVLTKVVFTTGTGSNSGNNLSVDSGTKTTSGATTTWTPADNETNFVTFTQGGTSGHARIQTISVEYKKIPAEEEPAFDYTKIAINPAEGTVESLENFDITFGGQTVTVNEDAEITLTANDEVVVEGGIELDEDGTLHVGLADRISAPGNYKLNIPAGAVKFNGEDLLPLAFNYNIAGPDYTVDPAEGEVESLSTFTITFNNYMVDVNEDEALAFLFNTETEEEVEATYIGAIAGGKQVYVAFPEVTAAGEWELNIIDGSITKTIDGTAIGDLVFHYTIAGAPSNAVAIPTTWNFSDWEAETFTETTTKDGLTVAAESGKTVVIDANNKTVDGVKYTQRLKLGGTGTANNRHLSFVAPGSLNIELIITSSSSGTDRELNIATGEFGNIVQTVAASGSGVTHEIAALELEGETTVYLYSKSGGINIYAIYLTEYNDGVATGIQSVNDGRTIEGFYNLNGQKVQNPAKGLYIVNGKKIVVK